MQKVWLLTAMGLLFFCMSISAQIVNKDSLSLVSKISADQLKLGKLQNQVEQKTKDQQDASSDAQRSADRNSTAADRLSDDPENKKLARRANKRAGDARSDARSARKEGDRLDDLHKDIRNTKKRITDNQVKLNKHIQAGSMNRPMTDTMGIR
ncbi:MAG TPA: hypothetical protein VF008_21645 [Niastella sp.]